MKPTLFPELPEGAEPIASPEKGAPRLLRPNRRQVQMRPVDLESLLPDDHAARVVWAFVERLDLSPLHAKVRAVEGHAGRPAIDPAILLALWLFATLDGVGSAREIGRLCHEHDAYRWICGGVGVNHHALSDFRVADEAFLDQILTSSVATLMDRDLVKLNRVAQDGVRVRASAGAGSFRRKSSLEKCLDEADAQVKTLKSELDGDPGTSTRRKQAAQLRAAEDRKRRVEEALAQMPEIEAVRARNRKKADPKGSNDDADDKKDAPRASTTDPEARVMKLADNGFRPAYNGQFATDVESQVIVGVDATNEGTDTRQLGPMLEQIEARYGRHPDEVLVDGGFGTLQTVENMPAGCTLYAPLPPAKNKKRDPYQPLPTDSPAVAAWRVRMGTEAAKSIYKQRAATAECVNALARNRGLQQFYVRGRRKVRCVMLFFALAHNLLREHVLTRSEGTMVPAA